MIREETENKRYDSCVLAATTARQKMKTQNLAASLNSPRGHLLAFSQS